MSKTQNQAILDYLKDGNSITQIDAFNMFNCFRLSARIHNLRESGHNIITNNVTINNKTFASYFLKV